MEKKREAEFAAEFFVFDNQSIASVLASGKSRVDLRVKQVFERQQNDDRLAS